MEEQKGKGFSKYCTHGLWPSPKTTDDWTQQNWKPLLKHGVTSYQVGRGYFIFEFIDKEDKDLIFRNGPYFMGSQGLYLNRWSPVFDPNLDTPKEVPVWVRLTNLPAHCWGFDSLQSIGNDIGRFIDREDPKSNYTCARICVEVDLEVGLPEAVKLTVGTWLFYQNLDYEHLLFKCRNCQEHGHFKRNFPKKQGIENNSEGWQKVKTGKQAPKARERNPEETPVQAPTAQQTPPSEQPSIPNPKPFSADTSPASVSKDLQPEEDPKNNTSHISIETEEGEVDPESDDGGTDTSSSMGTLEKATRGRKSDKTKREEKSYRDVALGAQKTIPDMMTTRSSKKTKRAPKGASPLLTKV